MLNKIFFAIIAAIMPLTATRGAYVGELQESWVIPSDHMPIALDYNGKKIVSWNVLHAEYMDWVVERDSQGLKRSVLGKAHHYIKGGNLTERDLLVIEKIQKMRFDVMTLQEASTPMLNKLKTKLPKNYQIIEGKSDLAVIYNANVFNVSSCDDVADVYTSDRFLQNVLFEDKDKNELRIINTHVPGDPNNPAHPYLMNYLVNSEFPEDVITIGDLNFNENEVAASLAAADTQGKYVIYSPPYATNISPGIYHSKIIDHAIVKSNAPVKMMRASYFDQDFQYTALLLDGAIRGDKAVGYNQGNDILRMKVLGHNV